VINFLLSTEIIPLCLRIMETGSELSKTVAIFIVQKILLDDLGLQYICQTYERFYAVGAVLGNMVATLVETQAVRLLKHVVRCYLRMSDNPRYVSIVLSVLSGGSIPGRGRESGREIGAGGTSGVEGLMRK
jgi:CCR4-NOT transcription complex subunit 9